MLEGKDALIFKNEVFDEVMNASVEDEAKDTQTVSVEADSNTKSDDVTENAANDTPVTVEAKNKVMNASTEDEAKDTPPVLVEADSNIKHDESEKAQQSELSDNLIKIVRCNMCFDSHFPCTKVCTKAKVQFEKILDSTKCILQKFFQQEK